MKTKEKRAIPAGYPTKYRRNFIGQIGLNFYPEADPELLQLYSSVKSTVSIIPIIG